MDSATGLLELHGAKPIHVVDGGLGEAQVHDAVRIAAAMHGAAVALELYPEQATAAAA